MLTALIPFFPFLANYIGNQVVESKVANVVKDVFGSETVPAQLTDDQKQQLQVRLQEIISAPQINESIQQTIRTESASEHWLVYSWRPLAILGCGFLLFIMVAFAISFGAYFMIHDGEIYGRFLIFYKTILAGMLHDMIQVFGMLAGGLALLRSTEKITGVKDLSMLTNFFKKK